MLAYIDNLVEAVPDEEELMDRISVLDPTDGRPPYRWTGICNLRRELRIVLETSSFEQDRDLDWILSAIGLADVTCEIELHSRFTGYADRLHSVVGPRVH
jgi:hypothetical protein